MQLCYSCDTICAMKTIKKLWFQPYTPILFLLLLLFVAYRFVYPTFQKAIRSDNTVQNISITPTDQVLEDETSIVNRVSKLLHLPSDEKPQIITITTIEQFKDQPFFKNAKNGDILLIYSKNKKAILYDPKNNIILDTAPIAATESGKSSATPSGF